MHGVDRDLERIRAFRREAKLSLKRLSDLAGLGSHRTVADLDRDTFNPTLATFRKLLSVVPDSWQPGDPLPDGFPVDGTPIRRARRSVTVGPG